jgi:hypothetical protein
LKRYIIAIALLSLVIFVSGCIGDSNQTNETKTYSQNNISFDYPASWSIATNRAPNATVSVADPRTEDSQTGYASTVFTIQKIAIPSGSNLNSVYNENYAVMFNNTSYQRIFEGNTTVNGETLYENKYYVNENGVQKEQRALWLQRDDNIYVILMSALTSDYEKEKPNFDLILNSLRIQG